MTTLALANVEDVNDNQEPIAERENHGDEAQPGDTENPIAASTAAPAAPADSALDLAELFKLQDQINEAAAREHAAKENYGIAKKNRESAQAALSEYIEEMRSPTLFNAAGAAAATKPAKPAPWREITTEELGIPESIAQKLINHNPSLATLGDIADYTARGGRLIDIKGIGEAKVEKIEDCCNRFWETYDGPRGEGYEAAESDDAESGDDAESDDAESGDDAESDDSSDA